ncbi:MAG: SH3 domain-containing protein [Solibacillus sp.]
MSFTVFSTPSVATAASITQYVKEDALLVDAAKKDAKVIATIKKFSAITVLSSSNDWSHVQFEKYKGYIQTAKLTSKKPTTTTKYIQAKNDIFLREKPSASATKMTTIPNRSAVFVYYSADGWSYIHYNKQKGFVYTSALTDKKPSTNVTGGLLPKTGLKLTYASEFLSSGKQRILSKKIS